MAWKLVRTVVGKIVTPSVWAVLVCAVSVVPAGVRIGTAQTQAAAPAENAAFAEAHARAKHGNPDAQFDLGLMYFGGHGVARDDVQAVAWWRKAAEGGSLAAHVYLGLMYATGQGVLQDDVQAVAWYRTAAERGFAAAQARLSSMYETGRGVPRDEVQAHVWMNLAALRATGENQAKYAKGRDLIATRLTPGQRAEAERIARGWTNTFSQRPKS